MITSLLELSAFFLKFGNELSVHFDNIDIMLSVDLYHFHFHFCESKLSLWMEKSFSLVEASIFASHFHVLVNEPLDLDSGIHLGWTVLESSNEDRKGLFTTWTVSTTESHFDGFPVDERDSSPSMLSYSNERIRNEPHWAWVFVRKIWMNC